MTETKAPKSISANKDLDYLFEVHKEKYNSNIKFVEGTDPAKVKVYCREPYAQSLYDMYEGRNLGLPAGSSIVSKDLQLNTEYIVKPLTINFDTKTILCEDVASRSPIFVNSSDFAGDMTELARNGKNFGVVLVRKNQGSFYGSNKMYAASRLETELAEHFKAGTCFEVVIDSLVKGGYMATYKNAVNVFVPGSHAAANIITDFSTYIGKTLPVAVDNYDASSNLYIVSYKKYVQLTLKDRIHELKFDTKYTGRLTNKPSEFGMFVEIDNYFTGLIHKTEFKNWNDAKKNYGAGSEIEVYVKDIMMHEKSGFRVMFTLDEYRINPDKVKWENLRRKLVGESFDYMYSEDSQTFHILCEDGENVSMKLSRDNVAHGLHKFKKVKVISVDVVRQTLAFDFVD